MFRSIVLFTALSGYVLAQTNSNRFRDYGVIDGKLGDVQIYGYIAVVTQLLGNGKNKNADKLLEETIKSECSFGYTRDTARGYGEGLGQFDKIAFDDVKARTKENTKERLKKIGVDLDKVEYSDLHKSPLTAIVFIRLKYLLVPSSIPSDDMGRYLYYKKWYNSIDGKATMAHYQEANKKSFFS